MQEFKVINMKRVTSLVLAAFLSLTSAFTQDFVLSNPVLSSSPAVFPNGDLTATFDLFLLEKDLMLSSDRSSANQASVKFTFSKLKPIAAFPSGDGADLFDWTISSNNATGADKEYYWLGTAKDVLMKSSPSHRKYKIIFKNVQVAMDATKIESDIKISGFLLDPASARPNSGGNNSCEITTYSAPAKCLSGFDFGDLTEKWKISKAKALADCNNDGIPDGPNVAVWAGLGVNVEENQKYSADASGDEYDDGLTIPSGTVLAGTRNVFTVTLSTNSSREVPAYYGLWFDWDNKGKFSSDVDFRVMSFPVFYKGSGSASFNGTPIEIPVVFPKGISGEYKARLIVSDKPLDKNSIESAIENGEIEDYQFFVTRQLVGFADFNVSSDGCVLNVDWKNPNEANVMNYEVEISRNGIDFKRVGEVKAENLLQYKRSFDLSGEVKSQVTYVRIKTVNTEGSYSFGQVRQITGLCADKNELMVTLYPNPILTSSFVNIHARKGVFNGNYTIKLLDAGGKLVDEKERTFENVIDFRYDLPFITNGLYRLILVNKSGSQRVVLEFVK